MPRPEQLKLSDYQLKEVDVRLYLHEKSVHYSTSPMNNPGDAVKAMKEILGDLDREMVCIVNLDTAMRPINYHVVSVGSINESMVPIQNIFKSGLLCNASNLMAFHNHPSGRIFPSLADQEVTKRIVQAGKLMDLPLVDHIIIGAGTDEVYSFRENDPALFEEGTDLLFSGEPKAMHEGMYGYKTLEAPGVNGRRNLMNTLRFNEFAEYAMDEIKNWMPLQYQDLKFQLKEVRKIGETYTGLTFENGEKGQSIVSPVISLSPYYIQYLNGETLDTVMYRLSDNITGEIEKGILNMDLAWVTDYEKVKNNLFVRVCNARENRDELAGVPRQNAADLVLTCHIRMNIPGQGQGSIMVTDQLLKGYGIPQEQLFKDALESSLTLLPVNIQQLDSMMSSMFLPHDTEMFPDGSIPEMPTAKVFVVTNSEMINGASALFYPDVMDAIAQKLGENFVILPSSVHEVLVMPESMADSYEEMENMVWEINQSTVEPKDRLSNHVYHYDVQERVFERGKDYESRSHEKPSILQALKSHAREAEAAMKTQAKPPRTKSEEMEL